MKSFDICINKNLSTVFNRCPPLSIGAKGTFYECIRYTIKDKVFYTPEEWMRVVGCEPKHIEELLDCGLFVVNDGRISIPTLDEVRQKLICARDFGSLGGSPAMRKNYNKKGSVYLAKSHDDIVKIGISGNPYTRIRQLRFEKGVPVSIIGTLTVVNMGKAENILPKHYESQRVYGEWFRLSESDIEFILNDGHNVKGIC